MHKIKGLYVILLSLTLAVGCAAARDNPSAVSAGTDKIIGELPADTVPMAGEESAAPEPASSETPGGVAARPQGQTTEQEPDAVEAGDTDAENGEDGSSVNPDIAVDPDASASSSVSANPDASVLPDLNTIIFTDFDLTFGQMALKYGDVTDSDYWAGGRYILHEYGLGVYFYELTQENAFEDSNPEDDARLNIIFSGVSALFTGFDGELHADDIGTIFGVNDPVIEADLSGEWFSQGYMYSLPYNGFTVLLSCDENGAVNAQSEVWIKCEW